MIDLFKKDPVCALTVMLALTGIAITYGLIWLGVILN